MSVSRPKPLSPHLQIFRWPLTMALSIGHRITGVGLSLGLLLLTWWLVALAAGPDAFAVIDGIVDSWFGALVLFGFTVATFLHFGNGVRHLVWDFGYGFELETVRRSAWAVVAFTVVATLVVWLALLAV